MARAALLAPLIALGLAAQAQGQVLTQDFVRPDCRDPMTTTAPIVFDTEIHERWYRRFWTGQCVHLARCIPGSPNWNEMSGRLIAKTSPQDRGAVRLKICRLGRLIGVEWSRSKTIRKIDLDDLRAFNRTLESAEDPLHGVDKVEAEVRAKLNRP